MFATELHINNHFINKDMDVTSVWNYCVVWVKIMYTSEHQNKPKGNIKYQYSSLVCCWSVLLKYHLWNKNMAPKYSISSSLEEVIFGHSISIAFLYCILYKWSLTRMFCVWIEYLSLRNTKREKCQSVLVTVKDKDTMQVSEMDHLVGFREVYNLPSPPSWCYCCRPSSCSGAPWPAPICSAAP